MVSNLLIQHMVRTAKRKHGPRIEPAGIAETWREAITTCDITNTITLWYNAPNDKSTHTVIIHKEAKE